MIAGGPSHHSREGPVGGETDLWRFKMFEVQIQVQAMSMNGYGGWVTIHATGLRSSAEAALRKIYDTPMVELNRVVGIRIIDETGNRIDN